MTGWFDIFRAHLFADMCWYKNNKWLLFSYFIWPYLMVALILGFGSLFGSIESYSERLGVSSPILFLLSSTVVAMSSISIVSSVAEFVIENRWSGTLPYIMLTPAETPIIFIAAGLPDAIISPLITVAAILPAALYLEGISGGIRILTILIFIFLGMLPLLGLSALIASLTLIAKEESNIGQIIIPFLLLVSGVYYPPRNPTIHPSIYRQNYARGLCGRGRPGLLKIYGPRDSHCANFDIHFNGHDYRI